MSPTRLLLAISLSLGLAACAPAGDAVVADGDRETPPPSAHPAPPSTHPAPPSNHPAPPEEEHMKCVDTGTSWAIGKLADEAMVQRVRTETHSERVRVIKPGMAVTMDFREDRVNIDVDADNRIVKVRCG